MSGLVLDVAHVGNAAKHSIEVRIGANEIVWCKCFKNGELAREAVNKISSCILVASIEPIDHSILYFFVVLLQICNSSVNQDNRPFYQSRYHDSKFSVGHVWANRGRIDVNMDHRSRCRVGNRARVNKKPFFVFVGIEFILVLAREIFHRCKVSPYRISRAPQGHEIMERQGGVFRSSTLAHSYFRMNMSIELVRNFSMQKSILM